MAYTKQLLYETLRTFDSAGLSGTYQAVGGPLLHPAAIVRIINNSGVLVTISTDGINAQDVLPTLTSVEYNATSNTPTHGSDATFIPQGRQYLVSGTASTGLIYVVVQYIVQV